MVINNEYHLSENNFIKLNTSKTNIVLGNTYSEGLDYYNGWVKRYGGNYKKTSHYSISKDGVIYNHFDSDYYSKYMDDSQHWESSISILLENLGNLRETSIKNVYLTDFNYTYIMNGEPFYQKWRGNYLWDTYTDKQLCSLDKLINMLCIKHNINKKISSDNIYNKEYLNKLDGIYYKSNLNEYCLDLSPSWDFKNFKGKYER